MCSKLSGLQYYFLEKFTATGLDTTVTFYEVRIFPIPLSIASKEAEFTPKAFDLWSSNDSFACVVDAALNLLYRTSRRRTIQMVLTSAWAGYNAGYDCSNVLNLLQLFTSHPSTSQFTF